MDLNCPQQICAEKKTTQQERCGVRGKQQPQWTIFLKKKSYAENFFLQRTEPVQAKQNFKNPCANLWHPSFSHCHNGLCLKHPSSNHCHNGLCLHHHSSNHCHNGLCLHHHSSNHCHNGLCLQHPFPNHSSIAILGYVWNTLHPTTAIMGYAIGLWNVSAQMAVHLWKAT